MQVVLTTNKSAHADITLVLGCEPTTFTKTSADDLPGLFFFVGETTTFLTPTFEPDRCADLLTELSAVTLKMRDDSTVPTFISTGESGVTVAPGANDFDLANPSKIVGLKFFLTEAISGLEGGMNWDVQVANCIPNAITLDPSSK